MISEESAAIESYGVSNAPEAIHFEFSCDPPHGDKLELLPPQGTDIPRRPQASTLAGRGSTHLDAARIGSVGNSGLRSAGSGRRATVLGWRGDACSIDCLIPLVTDKDPDVRYKAISGTDLLLGRFDLDPEGDRLTRARVHYPNRH